MKSSQPRTDGVFDTVGGRKTNDTDSTNYPMGNRRKDEGKQKERWVMG